MTEYWVHLLDKVELWRSHQNKQLLRPGCYNTRTTVSVLPVKLIPGAACRAVSSATATSGVFARNFSGMLPVLIISSAVTTAVASSYFLFAFSRARCSLCPAGSVALESKTSLTCQMTCDSGGSWRLWWEVDRCPVSQVWPGPEARERALPGNMTGEVFYANLPKHCSCVYPHFLTFISI